MNKSSKSKQALTEELESLKRRIRELEQAEARWKQAEELLRESKKRYRELTDILPLSISLFDVDAAGSIISYNRAALEAFRYNDEDYKEGMNALQFFAPEEWQRVGESMGKVIQGTSTPGQEFTFLRKDGSKFIGLIYASPNIHQGKTVGIRGAIIDITERKRAEEQIHRQSKLLAAINRIFYETLTADSEETVANTCLKVAQEMTDSQFGFIGEITPAGLFTTTALSDPGWEACPIPETQANVLIKDMVIRGIWGQVILKEQSLIVNDPVSYPDRFGIPEGHPPLTSFLGVPLKDQGKVIGMIAMANNASGYTAEHQKDMEALCVAFVEAIRRKQAEDALRNSKERFKNLYQDSPIPTFTWQKKGDDFILIDFNKAAMQMTDGKVVDHLGHSVVELYRDRPQVLGDFNLCFQERSVIMRETTSRHFAPGRFLTVNYGFIPPDLIIVHTEDQTDRKQGEEELQKTLERLRKAVGTTIQVLVSAVETRDPYTSGHQVRSAALARTIATEMGLSKDKIEGIRMAGSIHDIGKLSIPAEILSKPTKLSDIEFRLIKEHAKKGYEMLKDVESPWPLAEIVYQHHERMDGSGYPRNLKGGEILIEARILSVADVVEAMASHRPYRPALGLNAALEEIEKNSGTLYDKAVTDVCLRLFREKHYKFEGA